MAFDLKKLLTAVLTFCVASYATAQIAPLPIGTTEIGSKVAISAGKRIQRIGNAVLVRVLSQHTDSRYVTYETVLLACNGSWLSSTIHLSADFDKLLSFTEIESLGQSEETNLPLFPVQFKEIKESEHSFAGMLSKRAAQICKIAAAEPRNVLLPVAGGVIKGGFGVSEAIVSGTGKKNGDMVDAWVRSTDYKTIAKVGEENNLDGARSPTGSYTLMKGVYNCQNKESGYYHYVRYAVDGTPKITAIPREDFRLTPVTPGSVAETELEAVCRLYG